MRTSIFWVIFLLFVTYRLSGQHLPEALMGAPVFIEHNKGTGSGFLIQDSTYVYFVTARHVLIDPVSGKRVVNETKLTFYEKDLVTGDKIMFKIDLAIADSLGLIITKPHGDVLIIRMALKNYAKNGRVGINYLPGIQKLTKATNINPIPITIFEKYEDAFIGDNVYLFGYPTSIGLKRSPKFDYTRPLLRKGIIAGKYDSNKTLILDCPSYYGNSGGPVIVEVDKGLSMEYKLVGLVVEFIPYEEEWKNTRNGLVNSDIYNSGYSVAISSSKILELLNRK